VPRRDNRVVLGKARDELGVPRVELRWTLDEAEKRTYYRGRELVLEELDRLMPGLSQHRLEDPEPWPDGILGTWHHAGTTRMHDDPRQGVVDRNAKVHGIDNLFIAGSSVFPTSGSTAPTLTIVCLALRLADHLTGLLAA
jgi:choline dehydrogenase-like flavoprotein